MSDFIPVLSAGPHNNPKDGACIMEMVSFMSGDEWTDTPKCTDLFLAYLAQKVNDNMTNDSRHLILSQFDRLFNTALPESESRAWNNFVLKRNSLEIPPSYSQRNNANFAYLVSDELFYGSIRGRYPIEDEGLFVDILKNALDLYDEYTGRTEVESQDLNKLKEIANV